MQKTFLIFGLGNPGEKYAQTFHNAGWQVLDRLVPSEKFEENKKTDCLVAKIKKTDHNLLLAKPLSFMNLSGLPFKKVLSFYKLDPSQAIIVHDDADLPLGTLRFSFSRGSGGHNGLESIFQELGHQNLHRLRVGIGRPEGEKPLKNFVLEKIDPSEQKNWEAILEKAATSLLAFCENGPEKSATLFNGKNE